MYVVYLRRNVVIRICQLVQLVLQSDGRVVGTEHLGGQTGHEATQVLVEDGSVQTVEQVVAALLVLHEELQILEDTLLHLHKVVIADGILTQKVELDEVLFA